MILSSDPFNAFLDRPKVAVSGAATGPLAGLRLAVKDIFDLRGWRTGCGNPGKLEESAPARESAPAVRRLLDAGAVFVGKTQTDELAFSLFGQNSHFPHPINPAAPNRITGGSSSGSAAAVAGNLADVALGTDTGGSVRAPASFCGLWGLRPTHGRAPLEGVMPLAPSFDTAGLFTRDAEVMERGTRALLGEPDRRPPLGRLLALPALDACLLPEAAEEWARLKGLAAAALGEPESRELPDGIEDLYWCFRRLQGAEAWAAHGPWLSERDRGLGAGVAERFAFGASVDAVTAREESGRRERFRRAFEAMLGDDGALVLPTAPGAAPLASASADALAAYREQALKLLCLAGLSGLPQLTVPLGRVDGAPFGLSLIGPRNGDSALVALGRDIFEEARPWTR